MMVMPSTISPDRTICGTCTTLLLVLLSSRPPLTLSYRLHFSLDTPRWGITM